MTNYFLVFIFFIFLVNLNSNFVGADLSLPENVRFGKWSSSVNWLDVMKGDFNGDDKDDLVGRVGSNGDWWVGISDGSKFSNTKWTRWSSSVNWTDVMIGDFNGDGKDDIVGRVGSNGDWWVAISDGSKFSNTKWTRWSSSVNWDDVMVGDFNGDGKDDLVGRVGINGDWWVALSKNELENFVSVKGTDFYLNGEKVYLPGTNAYYLWYGDFECKFPGQGQGCVLPLLNSARDLNLKVIRTWGACEGVDKYGFCFQPSAGVYNEKTFKQFDRLIKEAGDRDIKLIISLANNWNDFGGVCKYLEWCGVDNYQSCDPHAQPGTLGAQVHDQFYTNECAKNLYKNYVNYFLNRKNVITGVKYKDDPTIMAWELINEPRARTDTSGDLLNNWIGEMSEYIKSIDSKHLVTTGIDGGYVNKGSDPYDWWYRGGEGQDYIRNHEWDSIDFAMFHYYYHMSAKASAKTWIRDHIDDAHNVIKKPVFFGEFNSLHNSRVQTLTEWYDLMHELGVNGASFWMLSDNAFYINNDGFFVRCPNDLQVCNVIRSHVNYMNSL
jgi:mannan endo-1,4-beta-mannosidase